ncbi:hypothetical protein H0H93_014693 [Arthromyces matolae]|nr:hypothetical protein H0H93_014693 [Arthromyces matolae]
MRFTAFFATVTLAVASCAALTEQGAAPEIYVGVHPKADPSECLNVLGNDPYPEQRVQLYPCNNSGAQIWNFTLDSQGPQPLRLYNTYCISAEDTYTSIQACGQSPQLWTYNVIDGTLTTLDTEGHMRDGLAQTSLAKPAAGRVQRKNASFQPLDWFSSNNSIMGFRGSGSIMGKLGLIGFFREQMTTLPPVEVVDLSGKTVMVIGANAGLGFEATKHFARMNPARLILACRSKEKGLAAIQKIEIETGYKNAELSIVDLSDFSSVVSFADRFEKDGGRLDILVENAAIAPGTRTMTKDGWETAYVQSRFVLSLSADGNTRLQVNCLSLFLIALRLLPQLVKTSIDHATRPRLVVVTSEVHFFSNLPKTVLGVEDIYRTLNDFTSISERYVDSKRESNKSTLHIATQLAPSPRYILLASTERKTRATISRHNQWRKPWILLDRDPSRAFRLCMGFHIFHG